MRAIRQMSLIIAKDLRIEMRSRHSIGLIVVLGTLIVVVLGMGLGVGEPVSGFGATAILWTAYLFAGVLCFEKTMTVERNDDALAGLLLAPIDRSAIYFAKLVTNLILMAALAAVVTPVAIVLFRFDLSAHPWGFALVMILGMTGFAAVGTLFAGAVSSSRTLNGLLAIIVFPLSLPLVIVSTQLMRRLFVNNEQLDVMGLATIVAFDAIFLVVSWIVFECVLEP